MKERQYQITTTSSTATLFHGFHAVSEKQGQQEPHRNLNNDEIMRFKQSVRIPTLTTNNSRLGAYKLKIPGPAFFSPSSLFALPLP